MKRILLALAVCLFTVDAQAVTGSEAEKSILTAARQTATPTEKRKIDHTLRNMKPFTVTHEIPWETFEQPIEMYGAEIPEDEEYTQRVRVETEHPDRYIVVNIPAFMAYVIENDRVVLQSKVVVGKGDKRSTKTPTMTTIMSEIVWNPYWAPPFKYSVNKTVSGWKRNKNYLLQERLSVLKRDDMTFVPNSQITEAILRSKDYLIVQTPGDDNMLGKALFMLDNEHDVYMHDTNSPNLFDHKNRNHSLGCIRVQQWLQIASWALDRPTPQILAEVGTGEMTFHKLEENIPVFVVYRTADVVNGEVVYYPDLYNWVK